MFRYTRWRNVKLGSQVIQNHNAEWFKYNKGRSCWPGRNKIDKHRKNGKVLILDDEGIFDKPFLNKLKINGRTEDWISKENS